MSDTAHVSTHGHGHGQDHVPHVLPLKVYLGAWGALLVLTVLTVGASYFNFGAWNLVIALVIATMKAATVALLFMHLWFDHKFHAIILSSSLVFLAVFIGFTMFDTETRGRADEKEHDRAADSRNPFQKAPASSAAVVIDVPLYNAGAPGGRGGLAPIAVAGAALGAGGPPVDPAAAAGSASGAPASAGSVSPATAGSSVPAISSAAPAASANAGAAASATATPRPVVSGGAASFTTRPAMRGDAPSGTSAALMASATGAVRPAPSASAATPPRVVPSAQPRR